MTVTTADVVALLHALYPVVGFVSVVSMAFRILVRILP